MQKTSQESFKDATNFILQQLDQRLAQMEQKSSQQEKVIKGIKKDRKLAHIISKPLLKALGPEESPAPASLSAVVKGYIRTNYPEPDGYVDDIDIQDEMVEIKPEESQMDIVQLLANSLCDNKSEFRKSASVDYRRSKSAAKIYTPMRTTKIDLEVEVGEEINQSGDKTVSSKGGERNLKVEPYTKWIAGSKKILSTKKVLQGFRGNIREFRDK